MNFIMNGIYALIGLVIVFGLKWIFNELGMFKKGRGLNVRK